MFMDGLVDGWTLNAPTPHHTNQPPMAQAYTMMELSRQFENACNQVCLWMGRSREGETTTPHYPRRKCIYKEITKKVIPPITTCA